MVHNMAQTLGRIFLLPKDRKKKPTLKFFDNKVFVGASRRVRSHAPGLPNSWPAIA